MEKIIVIVGATSSGKTSLSIDLAKRFNGEVISADSRQVYKGLDLASGKVTKEEMGAVPHHLLDIADVHEVFSASDFVHHGKKAMRDIFDKGTLPIIAGGTGFYIDSLLERISIPQVPPNKELRMKLENYTLKELQEMLEQSDPERYSTIDVNNPRRLVRAIEIADALGKNPPLVKKSKYDILWIGIEVPTEILKEKIRARLLERLDAGMIGELEGLHQRGLSYERMEQLGLECRYIARYLQHQLSREEMVEQLYSEIVKYARRQKQWFKTNQDIQWFPPGEIKEIHNQVENFLNR